MSHIDSFSHALVGYLAGVPVYHPLEDIRGDFVCGPEQLLIGGGSGEHPALVLATPAAAVAQFIGTELPHLALDETEREVWSGVVASHVGTSEEALKFYDWSAADHAAFQQRFQSDTLVNPFYSGGHPFHDWLLLGLGEFVFFAMPTLASEVLHQLHKPHRHFHHMRYNNILLVPPRIPVYANGGNAFKMTAKPTRGI